MLNKQRVIQSVIRDLLCVSSDGSAELEEFFADAPEQRGTMLPLEVIPSLSSAKDQSSLPDLHPAGTYTHTNHSVTGVDSLLACERVVIVKL